MDFISKIVWLDKKIILIAFFVFLTACGEQANNTELLQRAKNYVELGDLNAANLELKNILLDDTNNAEARYLLGKISLRTGDMKSAQSDFSRALKNGLDKPEAQVLLNETFYRQGYFQRVLDETDIKEHYPDTIKADLYGLKAVSLAGLGKWEDSAQETEKGTSITENSSWLYKSKIQQQIYNKSFDSAEKILARALKAFPDNQDLWLLSASLSERKKSHDDSVIALQKVIDLDPKKNITVWGRQARLAQGQIFIQQKEYARAKSAIDPVLISYPADPMANYLSALLAFKQASYEITEERILTALKTDPEHRPSLLLFGALSYVRGDYQKAAHYLEKVSTSNPDDLRAQTLLGRTYMMLGQYDAAENRFKFVSSQNEDDAEILALVGISQLKGGNTAEGLKELKKAAETAPDNAEIRNQLANAYMATGEIGSAIKELESTLKSNDEQLKTRLLLLLANLRAGQFDTALESANKLSEQFPEKPLLHNLAGVAYIGKKDPASARQRYEAALKIQPENTMALLSIANLDAREGKTDKAHKSFSDILKSHPDNTAAMIALAKLESQKGNTKKALELLEDARATNKDELESRLLLSNHYLNKGLPAKAMLYADEALVAAPQNLLVRYTAGRVQLAAGNKDALNTFERLAADAPDSPVIYFYLAEAQVRFKDITGAMKSLNKSIELKPDYGPALRTLGKLELTRGNHDAAYKLSRQLITALPDSADGLTLEGDILMSRKETNNALKVYQSALPHATSGEVSIKMSRAQRMLGKRADAYDTLNNWLAQHKEDQTVRFVLAMTYLSDGNNDEAIKQYETILTEQPENASVLNDLAWLYHVKDDSRALDTAEKAYKLSPDNPAIQDTYGWILVQSGRTEFGLVALEQAASNAPDSPDIRYHLAAALDKAGDKTRAREILKQILKTDRAFSERDAAEALQRRLN